MCVVYTTVFMNISSSTMIMVAVIVMCAVSTLRGALTTVTTVPFVGQALQVLGVVFLVQLAWTRWGGQNMPNISAWLPTPLPTLIPSQSPSQSPSP